MAAPIVTLGGTHRDQRDERFLLSSEYDSLTNIFQHCAQIFKFQTSFKSLKCFGRHCFSGRKGLHHLATRSFQMALIEIGDSGVVKGFL